MPVLIKLPSGGGGLGGGGNGIVVPDNPIVYAYGHDNSVTVSWYDKNDSGVNISGYNIYYTASTSKPSALSNYTKAGSVSYSVKTFNISNLTNDAVYWIVVTAYDGDKNENGNTHHAVSVTPNTVMLVNGRGIVNNQSYGITATSPKLFHGGVTSFCLGYTIDVSGTEKLISGNFLGFTNTNANVNTTDLGYIYQTPFPLLQGSTRGFVYPAYIRVVDDYNINQASLGWIIMDPTGSTVETHIPSSVLDNTMMPNLVYPPYVFTAPLNAHTNQSEAVAIDYGEQLLFIHINGVRDLIYTTPKTFGITNRSFVSISPSGNRLSSFFLGAHYTDMSIARRPKNTNFVAMVLYNYSTTQSSGIFIQTIMFFDVSTNTRYIDPVGGVLPNLYGQLQLSFFGYVNDKLILCIRSADTLMPKMILVNNPSVSSPCTYTLLMDQNTILYTSDGMATITASYIGPFALVFYKNGIYYAYNRRTINGSPLSDAHIHLFKSSDLTKWYHVAEITTLPQSMSINFKGEYIKGRVIFAWGNNGYYYSNDLINFVYYKFHLGKSGNTTTSEAYSFAAL